MKPITADEARLLAGPKAIDHVNAVFPLIRQAATEHNHSVKVRSEFWAQEGYRSTPMFNEAVKILTDYGFTVKYFYIEQQFVDCGIEIKW